MCMEKGLDVDVSRSKWDMRSFVQEGITPQHIAMLLQPSGGFTTEHRFLAMFPARRSSASLALCGTRPLSTGTSIAESMNTWMGIDAAESVIREDLRVVD
ncbi:MAG: hypothetical protein WDW36_001409 [Sanguina aurantia]